jgi:uncharacterized protein (TIGR00251 family)
VTSIQPTAEGVSLLLRVTPRASKDEIAGESDGVMKIRLRAPAVEGRANEALVRFLADRLGMPKRCVTIVAGQTRRTKRVMLSGVTESVARKALEPLSEPT